VGMAVARDGWKYLMVQDSRTGRYRVAA
jgi:hypothetical protein